MLADEGRNLFNSLVAGRPIDARTFPSQRWQATCLASATTACVPPCSDLAGRQFPFSPPFAWSALAMRGVPVGVIAAQLGHSDTRIGEHAGQPLSLAKIHIPGCRRRRESGRQHGRVGGCAPSPTPSCRSAPAARRERRDTMRPVVWQPIRGCGFSRFEFAVGTGVTGAFNKVA